jgi:hypothetical protein
VMAAAKRVIATHAKVIKRLHRVSYPGYRFSSASSWPFPEVTTALCSVRWSMQGPQGACTHRLPPAHRVVAASAPNSPSFIQESVALRLPSVKAESFAVDLKVELQKTRP